MGFSRQEYWSGMPCPPPGDLPKPETEPESLTSPALASGSPYHFSTWLTRLIHELFTNDFFNVQICL